MKHALKNSIKDNMHGLLECIFVEYAATRSYQIVWEPVPGKLPSDWEAWRKFHTSLLRARRSAAP
jgi:hypothetical protein